MKNIITCLALVLASSALAEPKTGCCDMPKGMASCCPGPCCVAKAPAKKALRLVAKAPVVKVAKKSASCCAGGKCCPGPCCG